jgi:hypothetical protein
MKRILTLLLVMFFVGNTSIGQIPTNGLVGWWAFNGNANDLSGLGNNGNIIGTPIFMTDRFGQQNAAIDLDLSQVQVPDAASLDLTSDFTITLWAQIYLYTIPCSGTTCILTLLDKGNSYGIQHTNQKDLGGNPINNRYLGFTNLNSGNACGIDNFHYLPIMPTWEFVAYKIQWNSIYNDFDRWLYINAQYVTNNYCNTPPQANSNDLIFGSLWARPLDDIRIYNRALSHEEIIAIYNETPLNIILQTPNGGEIWQAGTNQTILYNAVANGNVNIQYSTDNGTNWSTIFNGWCGVGNNAYLWTVPNTPSNQCIVRITDTNNSLAFDQSDSVFTILALPTINVTSPNGYETWQVGMSSHITWNSTDVNDVQIDYSINNGNSWIPIINSTPASAGDYLWTVPNTPSTHCRVKITNVSNPAINDISNNNFTITPAVGINEQREDVKIFPNPTTGKIQLYSDKPITDIVIYNFMGQQVGALQGENPELTFDISIFGKGIYYFRMIIGDRPEIHKVVVL